LYTPGSLFYADGRGRNQMRLSFSDVSPERIEEGVRRLAKVIGAALRNVHRRGSPGRGESPPLV
jgi:DNA-binding transcriptional MocR family regulator